MEEATQEDGDPFCHPFAGATTVGAVSRTQTDTHTRTHTETQADIFWQAAASQALRQELKDAQEEHPLPHGREG